jgi:hypothetical protein
MFGLFTRPAPGVKVIDKVWMSRQARLNACAGMLQANPDCLFVAWFDETFHALQQALGFQENKVILARDIASSRLQGRMVVFAEHFPLAAVEQALFSTLGMKEIPVLSAMDEPLFMRFGGEGMIELMRRMGMKENEVVSHSMVSKSIRRAQDAIRDRASTDHSAASQQEWFSLNMR